MNRHLPFPPLHQSRPAIATLSRWLDQRLLSSPLERSSCPLNAKPLLAEVGVKPRKWAWFCDNPKIRSEQRAVIFLPNLREVSHGRLRIRYKPETVLGRRCERRIGWWGRYSQFNGSGVLDEITPESRAIGERSPFANALPSDAKRLERGAHQAQGVQPVQTVRHCERVEHTAQTVYLKHSLALSQIDVHVSFRDFDCPYK